jgi:hypothetical protein
VPDNHLYQQQLSVNFNSCKSSPDLESSGKSTPDLESSGKSTPDLESSGKSTPDLESRFSLNYSMLSSMFALPMIGGPNYSFFSELISIYLGTL